MLPRADGGYAARSSADTPFAAEAIKPATVSGRHLLLARLHGGSERSPRRSPLPTASRTPGSPARAPTARPTCSPAASPARYPAPPGSRLTTECWCGSSPSTPRFWLPRAHDGHSGSDFPRSPSSGLPATSFTPTASTLTLLGTTYRKVG